MKYSSSFLPFLNKVYVYCSIIQTSDCYKSAITERGNIALYTIIIKYKFRKGGTRSPFPLELTNSYSWQHQLNYIKSIHSSIHSRSSWGLWQTNGCHTRLLFVSLLWIQAKNKEIGKGQHSESKNIHIVQKQLQKKRSLLYWIWQWYKLYKETTF